MENTPESTALRAEGATTPSPTPTRPLSLRLRLWLRLWTLKLVIKTSLNILRFFRIQGMGILQPTYKKQYAVGANLTNEVWIPSSFRSGQKLPLYIDIHGGGFAIGDPFHDSEWCNYLAEKQGIVVVSLDYRKAPTHWFPSQTNELVQLVHAVLKDTDLPVDKTKICMGGFSAGGNLSLSVAQEPSLLGKIKGLLLWYPVTDFSGTYKGTMKNAADGSPDVLEKTSELFNYGYVAEDTDRKDPRLSPVFADRNNLPKKLAFIGAEEDVLCFEAEKTAELYAGQEGKEKVFGKAEKGLETWTAGSIVWTKVLGAQHGFNYLKKKEPVAEAKRVEITERAYALAAEWLKREIYA